MSTQLLTQSYREKNGFTLIELLVVVAIISLLAAMLSSGVTTVKGKVKSVHCMSNLRQLGLAAEVYTLNFSGYLPHEDAGSGGSPPENCAWYDVLTPYLKCNRPEDAKQCPEVEAEDDWHTYKMNSKLEQDPVFFYKMGSTKRESNTIFLYDGRIDNSSVRSQVKGTCNMAASPHQDATNLVFLDTHVESYRAVLDEAGWLDDGPFVWDP